MAPIYLKIYCVVQLMVSTIIYGNYQKPAPPKQRSCAIAGSNFLLRGEWGREAAQLRSPPKRHRADLQPAKLLNFHVDVCGFLKYSHNYPENSYFCWANYENSGPIAANPAPRAASLPVTIGISLCSSIILIWRWVWHGVAWGWSAIWMLC